MNPIVSFSGLATGIDTASIVDTLVQLERRPIGMLQDQQRDLRSVKSRLSDFSSLLGTLQDAAADLDSRPEVLVSSASSSDESSVVVTADGASSLGAFTMEVTSLATAERTYSDAFAAKDTAGLFGSGTLTLQVGTDASVDVTVDPTDTLEVVVSKINSSGADVTAGIVFDGTQYRLQVSGNDTGVDRAITFTETGTTLGLDNPANQIQAALDAVFTIDGFPMTRPSNIVGDAIPGVNLELKAPTSGPTTISIQRDPEALEEKVQAFVDAYNAVATKINGEFAFSGGARFGDSLSGDSTLRQLQRRLRDVAGQTVSGLSTSFDRLAEVGIEFGSDGTLELDADELRTSLSSDPEGVAKLFMSDPVAGTTGVMASFDSVVEEFTQKGTGLLALKIDGVDDRVAEMDDQIERMELRIVGFEERLRAKFIAMEQIVSNIQGQGNQLLSILSNLNNQSS